MEKHFLAHCVEGEPEFRPEPWYNSEGDCIVYHTANEAVIADRIDEVLTIYRSAVDRRAIGFQIKGVAALIKRFGLDAVEFRSEISDQTLVSVSVVALLLAAYDDGPRTVNRRVAYAAVIETSPRCGIPAADLQPT